MFVGKQIQSIVVNSKTSAKIEGLRPYTEYSIYIRGYAHESGAGPKSEIVTVRTDPDSEYSVTSYIIHTKSGLAPDSEYMTQVKHKLYNTYKVRTHPDSEYNVTSQVKIIHDKLYNTDKVKTHLNIENKLQVKSV